ncbi:MAG: sigma-70 family RNA polymerase sigma factor [Myxococcales bacterium]|nr:sigma-70 family RNA polymerase sigma factor [Myxococcales bacterium]
MELTDAEVEQLYHRYAHVLFHRCRSIVRNDEEAWDAVHETFAKVIRNAETFRHQSSPLTWMYRISTNHCLNQVRNRRGRERKHEDHAHDLGADRVAVQADEDPDKERILALLEDADEETRACVVHTYFDDCTREEVAQLVGLSVPTVRKRVNTFLDHARRALGVALTVLFLLWRWS